MRCSARLNYFAGLGQVALHVRPTPAAHHSLLITGTETFWDSRAASSISVKFQDCIPQVLHDCALSFGIYSSLHARATATRPMGLNDAVTLHFTSIQFCCTQTETLFPRFPQITRSYERRPTQRVRQPPAPALVRRRRRLYHACPRCHNSCSVASRRVHSTTKVAERNKGDRSLLPHCSP